MSEINPDDLDIIKDILDDDEDDPIFGNSKNQTNKSNLDVSSNTNTQNIQNSNATNRNVNKTYNSIINFDPKKSNIQSSSNGSSNLIQKCTPVYIGGSKTPVGMTTEANGPHACSNLYCIKCDHNVLRFTDRKWKKSTDYLFLRNNFPENVNQNLIISSGWCAYCCQCTFCEEQNLRKLSAFSSNWVCRGHR